MSFSPADIHHIAHLARLVIDEKELPAYIRNLSRILEMVEQVNAVATEGVEPLWHPSDMTLRLRPDRVDQSGDLEALNETAPAAGKGLYLVPKVIK